MAGIDEAGDVHHVVVNERGDFLFFIPKRFLVLEASRLILERAGSDGRGQFSETVRETIQVSDEQVLLTRSKACVFIDGCHEDGDEPCEVLIMRLLGVSGEEFNCIHYVTYM